MSENYIFIITLNGIFFHSIRNRISQLVGNLTLNFGIAAGNFGVTDAFQYDRGITKQNSCTPIRTSVIFFNKTCVSYPLYMNKCIPISEKEYIFPLFIIYFFLNKCD